GVHASADQLPAGAAIARLPDAAGRNRHANGFAVARIDADRMDTGGIVTAAIPLLAFIAIPQRAIQRPAVALIARDKQPAWQCARPQHPRLIDTTRFERPHLLQIPRLFIFRSLRLRWIHGCRRFLPARSAVARAPHLYAEMTEIQRDVQYIAARIEQHHADRLGQKMRAVDMPLPGCGSLQNEQTLARTYQQTIGHHSPLRLSP